MTQGISADTEAVFQSGRGVSALHGEAQAIVNRYLEDLESAAGVAGHPKVKKALDAYLLREAPKVREVPVATLNLGQGTSAAAVELSEGDASAATAIQTSGAEAQDLAQRLPGAQPASWLTRPI